MLAHERRGPLHRRRKVFGFGLGLALIAVILAVQSTYAAAGPPVKPPLPGAPLAGPQEGPTAPVSPIVTCTKTVTVLIQVYQFFSEPTSNGCWGYNRSYQNAGQGMNNWTICFGPGRSPSKKGTGPNRVYDDTSPRQDLSAETTLINGCGNLYGEDMARRDQINNWCTNNGYPSPCWRRNPASVVVSRYFAELYATDGNVDNYYGDWTATGNGANPSNSFGIWNIRPLAFSYTGNTTGLYNKVVGMCNVAAGHGGYFSIYSGPVSISGQPDITITQTDVNTFSSAMSYCSTH